MASRLLVRRRARAPVGRCAAPHRTRRPRRARGRGRLLHAGEGELATRTRRCRSGIGGNKTAASLLTPMQCTGPRISARMRLMLVGNLD